MVMSNDDVARAGQSIRRMVMQRYPGQKAAAHTNVPAHLLYMLDCIDAFMSEGRREKAMRWLGFAQGVAWVSGWASIEEMKDDNRPSTAASQ